MKDWEKKVRSWAWERLVFLADRISPEDAFRATGLYIHLKKGEGWVLDDRGIQVWYKGMAEYKEHSHEGYEDTPIKRLLMEPYPPNSAEDEERKYKAMWRFR